MIELRPYQQDALRAIFEYWNSGGGNPLVSLATGTGKSLLIAKLVQDLLRDYPAMRVLVLTHVKELIGQDVEALKAIWPDAPLGINSASLGSRDCDQQILFASVKSVYRTPEQLGARDLVIIDEAHLVPHSGAGMYLRRLSALRQVVPDMRVCGFTATPYRLDSGRLNEGDGIFHDVVYEYDIGEAIRDGWLSPLSSKATKAEIDVTDVSRRSGDFAPEELEDAADNEDIVQAAADEIAAHGAQRRTWLVFSVGVRHAAHVCAALRARHIDCEVVTSATPQKVRDELIDNFRAGRLRCLVNCQVLTTGFNALHVDLIAMLRPTLSTGLYVQMVGRGTRKAPGKHDCLVLDFAGNVRRHGPVDRVSVKKQSDTAVRPDTVRAKVCPQCAEIVVPGTPQCVSCGYEWPVTREPKHQPRADAVSILASTQEVTWIPVTDIRYYKHYKRRDPSAPPSLRIEYLSEFASYSNYVAIENPRASYFAARWWHVMGGNKPMPATVDEAIERRDELGKATHIVVTPSNDFWEIIQHWRVQVPDGSVVEIDSRYRREIISPPITAGQIPLRELLNDEIPY